MYDTIFAEQLIWAKFKEKVGQISLIFNTCIHNSIFAMQLCIVEHWYHCRVPGSGYNDHNEKS